MLKSKLSRTIAVFTFIIVSFFICSAAAPQSSLSPNGTISDQDSNDITTASGDIPAGEILGEESKGKENDIYEVTSSTDGDTIKIDYNGTIEKVRLIGIDTPETKECFYLEAKKKLQSLIGGKSVRIEPDSSQGERDKYGRLLLYIWVDSVNINEKMIKAGFAYEYTYNLPYKYQDSFKQAQQEARENKKGLWGDACSCTKGEEVGKSCTACKKAKVTYYNWDCSTYEQEVTDTACTSGCYVAPAPQPTPEPTPPPQPSYVCDCSKTCPNMSSCEEAQYQLKECGCKQRDHDKDGVACDVDCQ
jgi:endonuclease YncB( thermonuclease family)